MKVLSLFNGMNTGRIALENVGIKVEKYYSSEIKPYANKLTQHHYPDTIQLGSASIAIACNDLGFDLTACEIDKDYFDAAIKRFQTHISQSRIVFPQIIEQKPNQTLF